MSSGLPLVPGMAASVVRRLSPMAMTRIKNLGMTPRQQRLNWLWTWYCTTRYDARKVDWDGTERIDDPLDAEAIGTAGVLPGGFYDAGQDFPLKFRRPSVPYPLPRVIVNRFTGLLFSESQHPKIKALGNDKLEDYANALANAARLWASMVQARSFGGATGTFCVGYKFVGGKPMIEVLDPRWVTPQFKNRDTLELESIDFRYIWPESVLSDSGEWEEAWYWTRRLVDGEQDIVWNKVSVGDGTEPVWAAIRPDAYAKHGQGEIPFVWGQNLPVTDSEDGEPDCLGLFDMVEEMDALLSQGGMSLKRNLDPTLLILTAMKLAELRKGSDNAIKLGPGEDAKYLEAALNGPKEARDHSLQLREFVLECAQCVLDSEDVESPETATKARERQANMHARADIFREQYGQKAILPLLEKMLRGARRTTAAQPGAAPNGGPLRRIIILPPREITQPDGTKTWEARELPQPSDAELVGGSSLALEWPPYRRPTPAEAQAAASAVKAGIDAGALSIEQAVRYLQPYFGAESAEIEVARIKAETKARQDLAQAQAREAFASRAGG